MNTFDLKIKALAALHERVQGFLKDRYHIVVNYKSDDLCMVKLRHHNGNRIVIKLYVGERRIVQHTNHILTYEGKVC